MKTKYILNLTVFLTNNTPLKNTKCEKKKLQGQNVHYFLLRDKIDKSSIIQWEENYINPKKDNKDLPVKPLT